MTASMRRIEVRIGVLLGPAEDVKTGPGRNASVAAEALSKDQRHEFRQMAAHPDVVEAVTGVGSEHLGG